MPKYKSLCEICGWSGSYLQLYEDRDGFNVCPMCHSDTELVPNGDQEEANGDQEEGQ